MISFALEPGHDAAMTVTLEHTARLKGLRPSLKTAHDLEDPVFAQAAEYVVLDRIVVAGADLLSTPVALPFVLAPQQGNAPITLLLKEGTSVTVHARNLGPTAITFELDLSLDPLPLTRWHPVH